MKRYYNFSIFVALFLSATTISANSTTINNTIPTDASKNKESSWNISPLGTVRVNAELIDLNADDTQSRWSLNRAYIGVSASHSSGLQAKVIYDAAASDFENTSQGALQRQQGFVKEAWFSLLLFPAAIEGISFKTGIMLENHIYRSLKTWNRYYLRNNILMTSIKETSADLGAIFSYDKKNYYADVSIMQGNGFKNISTDVKTEKYQLSTGFVNKVFNTGLWFSYRPYRHDQEYNLEPELKQFFYAGLNFNKISLGLELGHVKDLMGQAVDKNNISALAINLVSSISKNLNIIVRGEATRSKENESDKYYTLSAIEYQIMKKAKIAAKYEFSTMPYLDDNFIQTIGLNSEVSF